VRFEFAFLPMSGRSDTDLWFVFSGDKLLVKTTAIGPLIPSYSDLVRIKQNLSSTHYLGTFEGIPCYSGEVDKHIISLEGMIFQELRPLLGLLGVDIFSVAREPIRSCTGTVLTNFAEGVGVTLNQKMRNGRKRVLNAASSAIRQYHPR